VWQHINGTVKLRRWLSEFSQVRLGLRFDVKATDYLHRPAGSNTAANVIQAALKTVANNRSDWGGGGFHFV